MPVVSALAAALTVGYRLWDEEELRDALGFGLMAFPVTLLVLIYGRWAYLWVGAGFQGTASTRGSEALVPPGSAPAENGPEGGITARAAGAHATAPPLQPEETTQASYWPRFWSRCVDLPIVWVLGSSFAAFLPTVHSVAAGWGGIVVDLVLGMTVICVVIFAYEVAFVALFNATPGKMLFGLSVLSTDNRMPTRSESQRRAWGYLKSGLYFTFYLPFLQILGAGFAWKRRHGSQPWDLTARTFVSQRPISPVRYGIAAVFAFCLVTVMVGAHMTLKELTKREVRESVLR